MDSTQDSDAALQWQDAERAMVHAQVEFDRVLHLYLVRRGPAPTAAMADALAAKRRAAFRALLLAHESIRRCRSAMRIL